MIRKILLAIPIQLLLALVGLAIFVAVQPADFHLTRSDKIDAPPAQVFAQVNDFHNWKAWSPWVKLDPNAKESFLGPSSGTGAGFTWAGNEEVGEGRMTIVESKPNELVRIKLEFM